VYDIGAAVIVFYTSFSTSSGEKSHAPSGDALEHGNTKDLLNTPIHISENVLWGTSRATYQTQRGNEKGKSSDSSAFGVDWDITDFMRTANLLYKRELHNTAGRNIYFALWDDFIWFVNWMSDYVSEVHTPINEQHILDMHTPGIVLRDKLWHGRFNFRVEFSMMRQRDPITFNMQEVPMGEREKIFHFIETNFEDYRFSNKDTKWFYNYLYCDQEEWNALEGFANLSFKHSIRLVDKIKLFSEL